MLEILKDLKRRQQQQGNKQAQEAQTQTQEGPFGDPQEEGPSSTPQEEEAAALFQVKKRRPSWGRDQRMNGRCSLDTWVPSVDLKQKKVRCYLTSCLWRVYLTDRRGHILTAHLPRYFGNEYEEPRLTPYQKVRFRLEYVNTLMEAKGLESDMSKEQAVKRILRPHFEETVMAPLDQLTIKAYCREAQVPVPYTFHLSKMDTLGLFAWQGGISLLLWISNEQMEQHIPRLLRLADNWY